MCVICVVLWNEKRFEGEYSPQVQSKLGLFDE